MPKKIDEELKATAVRLVNHHQCEHPSLTAAAAVVAKQLGVPSQCSIDRTGSRAPYAGGMTPGGEHDLFQPAGLKAIRPVG